MCIASLQTVGMNGKFRNYQAYYYDASHFVMA